MQGLNVRINILERANDPDDVIGGSVRQDVTRYADVLARISNARPSRVLVEQGYEVQHVHSIIIYPDIYPAIQEEDIVVPTTGRWAGARFKVIGFQPSSLRPGETRAHVQLNCIRVRYADDNVPEEPFGVIPDEDVSTGLNSSAAATSLTYEHTVGAGDNRFLVVGILLPDSTTPIVTSVTFNGLAMTQSVSFAPGLGFVVKRLYLYTLVNPPAGTFNVVITTSVGSRSLSVARSYANVLQATPLRGTATNSASSTLTISTAIASDPDDLVIDFLAAFAGMPPLNGIGLATAEQVADAVANQLTNQYAAGSHEAGADGNVTLAWQEIGGSLAIWGHILASIRRAA